MPLALTSFDTLGRMIRYSDSTQGVTAADLDGFFVGWASPPAPATHLRILRASARVWLAIDGGSGRVVGFVTAITDGVLSASIPLLEVLPAHRGRGIGSELVKRMLTTLDEFYAVDVVCDDDVRPFYERMGLKAHTAMVKRNYDRQSGAVESGTLPTTWTDSPAP